VDWNELPQVAAFDFAFVQHDYPRRPVLWDRRTIMDTISCAQSVEVRGK
jgi:hypothetical protein